MGTAEEILQFWFHELDAKMQFAKSVELDQKIRDRFLQTYMDAAQGKTAPWRTTAHERLAEILVVD